jgi:DNA processing protein
MASYDRSELHPGDAGYPACLAETPRPPRTLYVAGDPSALRLGLGVVGSRKATPYGLACAQRFAGWAAAQGVTIVSGAAYGCDQAAQRAALAEDGRTVAVLGCGADVDYPSGAADLLDTMRRDGAVVSELPWGTPPTRWAFPERNRIIAGLSAALLVVEAGLPSGTFSTADHALDASRDVLAVPGSIFAPECRGANRLIRQGAFPVTDVSELAEDLRSCGLLSALPDGGDREQPQAAEESDPVARALLADPMRPDDLARALAMDIIEVMRRLARLETAGVAHRYPDGRYGPGPRR